MRLSLVSTAICGTLAVSALTIPQQSPVKRFELVDLKPFEDFTFELLSPEKAKAAAAADKSNVSPVAGLASAAQNGGVAGIMAGTCKSPKVRYEWRDLTDAHKKEFVNAVKCLLNKPSAGGSNHPGSKNRYEDLVSVHQQMTPTIHMVAQFLPWHRYYLSVYESMLRDECAYTGPMPWWDESKDAGKFSSAPMFTDAYFGSAPKKTTDGKGTCVTDGVSLHSHDHAPLLLSDFADAPRPGLQGDYPAHRPRWQLHEPLPLSRGRRVPDGAVQLGFRQELQLAQHVQRHGVLR